MTLVGWKEILTTTLHNRRGRVAFDFPPGFVTEIMSRTCWGDREWKLSEVVRMFNAMEANLNGLCIDGAGI